MPTAERYSEEYISWTIPSRVKASGIKLSEAESASLSRVEDLRSNFQSFGVKKALDPEHFAALSDKGAGTIVISDRIRVALRHESPGAISKVSVVAYNS